jgi:exopolyphosphatase / guanosine-5'-triphosphate,3'-diphosphate pyrophosphatase
MKNIAVIDLGTNTFNLLIACKNDSGYFMPVFQNKISVKLGEGGINNNLITEEAMLRGINALQFHLKETKNYNCETILAFATSAIREASNGQNFVQLVLEKLSLKIQIITGDKEAELIYWGVRKAVQMNNSNSLIIDIGGGSTEFIIADKNRIIWKQSFLLGASRLLEKFKPSDPITDEEHQQLIAYLSEQLQPLTQALKSNPVVELIGSSGSFDSLAEMIAHRFHSPEILNDKTEYEFDLDECREIYESVIKSTKAERLQMKGLIEMRVDMFVISSIIVHHIITHYEIKKMRLSTYSLKEGVLHEIS